MGLKLFTLFHLLFFVLIFDLHAVIHHYNSPIAIDSRVKTYVYSPNEVFIIKGHHDYKTFIEFSHNEHITYTSTGDGVSWHISQDNNYPNVLILQPSDKSSRTNMVVFTNQRKYLFDLISKEEFDVEVAYSVRFYYVDEEIEDSFDHPGKLIDSNLHKVPTNEFEQFQLKDEDDVDINMPYKEYISKSISQEHLDHSNYTSNKSKKISAQQAPTKHVHHLNFSYDITGDKDILPYEIFDNGKVTFIKFPMSDAYLPNIFILKPDGSEVAIKMVLFKDYVVLNGVHEKITMRYKDMKVNVYNKGIDYGK